MNTEVSKRLGIFTCDERLRDSFQPFLGHPIISGIGFAGVIGNRNLVDPASVLEQGFDNIALVRFDFSFIHPDFVQISKTRFHIRSIPQINPASMQNCRRPFSKGVTASLPNPPEPEVCR